VEEERYVAIVLCLPPCPENQEQRNVGLSGWIPRLHYCLTETPSTLALTVARLMMSELLITCYILPSQNLYRELSKAAEPYIKQEDEGKFRCKTCQKLFKATSFVEKHIANKHPELVKSLDDVNDMTHPTGFLLMPLSSSHTSTILLSIPITYSHTVIYLNPEAPGSRRHLKHMVYPDHLLSHRPITCEEPTVACSTPRHIHQAVSRLRLTSHITGTLTPIRTYRT
jgi:hypothetical protein